MFKPVVDSYPTRDTALLEPWALCESDLPWLKNLFGKKYPSGYDAIAAESWFRNIVLKQPMMFRPVRLANSFAISMLSCMPWLPSEFECHVVAVCADDGAMWECLRLLRDSVGWARLRKCSRWRLSSDTEHDLFNFAKRLGATEISPRFTLEL
jgi:hypothetical protein